MDELKQKLQTLKDGIDDILAQVRKDIVVKDDPDQAYVSVGNLITIVEIMWGIRKEADRFFTEEQRDLIETELCDNAEPSGDDWVQGASLLTDMQLLDWVFDRHDPMSPDQAARVEAYGVWRDVVSKNDRAMMEFMRRRAAWEDQCQKNESKN